MAVMTLTVDHDFKNPRARAAIGAGVDAGVIEEDGKQLALGERTVPTFWDAVLNSASKQPHDPFTPQAMSIALRGTHDLSQEQAETTAQVAREHGSVYRDDETGQIKVNTPRDEKGPEIDAAAFDRDAYPVGGDDSDSDDSSGDDDSGGDGSGGDGSDDTYDGPDGGGETPATDDSEDASPTPADANGESAEPDTASTHEEAATDTETTDEPEWLRRAHRRAQRGRGSGRRRHHSRHRDGDSERRQRRD
jgi:hypothetical protein